MSKEGKMKRDMRTKVGYVVKRVVAIVALMCIMTSPMEIEKSEAQVFILSEDEFNNSERMDNSGIPVLPQGWGDDWIPEYTPVGNGLLILAFMGSAYKIAKSRKRKEAEG